MDTGVLQEMSGLLPSPAVVAMALLVAVGVVVWLLGGRLARAACVVSGLVLGGLAGFAVGRALEDEGGMALPLAIGAAIAGALLSGLLFRVWMGLSGAVLLALAVPAAVIVWQGTPTPEVGLQAEAAQSEGDETDDEVRETRGEERPERRSEPRVSPRQLRTDRARAAEGAAEAPVEEEGGEGESAGDAAAAVLQSVLPEVRSAATGLYEQHAESIAAWWDELAEETRWALRLAGLIGAGVGLALGLIAPLIAASVQSALTGSILIYLPGRALVALLAPEWVGWFPATPRGTLLMLGLITITGVLIQWTLFRRRADK